MSDSYVPTEVEPVKIYDPAAVGLAVFFGSPVAGGWLLRTNYNALGDKRKGSSALFVSLVFSVGIFAMAFLLPEDVPTSLFTVFNATVSFLYSYYATKQFGKDHEVRKVLKKGLYSKWRAAGIGLVSSVVILGSIFGVAYLCDEFKYNTEADRKIKELFAEIAGLEEQTDILMNRYDKANDDSRRAELLREFGQQWEKIGTITEKIERLAVEAERTGTIGFLGLYRQIPPLKVEVAENFRKSILEDDAEAYNAAIKAQAEIDWIDKLMDKFFDTLGEEGEDVYYLLP